MWITFLQKWAVNRAKRKKVISRFRTAIIITGLSCEKKLLGKIVFMKHERVARCLGSFNWNAVFSALNAPARRTLVFSHGIIVIVDRFNNVVFFSFPPLNVCHAEII